MFAKYWNYSHTISFVLIYCASHCVKFCSHRLKMKWFDLELRKETSFTHTHIYIYEIHDIFQLHTRELSLGAVIYWTSKIPLLAPFSVNALRSLWQFQIERNWTKFSNISRKPGPKLIFVDSCEKSHPLQFSTSPTQSRICIFWVSLDPQPVLGHKCNCNCKT